MGNLELCKYMISKTKNKNPEGGITIEFDRDSV